MLNQVCCIVGRIPEQLKHIILQLSRTYCPLVQDEAWPNGLRLFQSKDMQKAVEDMSPIVKLQRAMINNIAKHALCMYLQASYSSLKDCPIAVRDVGTCDCILIVIVQAILLS